MYSDWTLTHGLCPGVEQDATKCIGCRGGSRGGYTHMDGSLALGHREALK